MASGATKLFQPNASKPHSQTAVIHQTQQTQASPPKISPITTRLATIIRRSGHRPLIHCAANAAIFLGVPLSAGSAGTRSEEHTSELQSLVRISYAVLC